MSKSNLLVLLGCLIFTLPLAAEKPRPKKAPQTNATIADLKEALQRAQIALQDLGASEAKAKAEALLQREKAEAARVLAERERTRALEALEEAQKQKLISQKQAEAAARALEAEKNASRKAQEIEALARKQAEVAQKAAYESLKKAQADTEVSPRQKQGRRARRRNSLNELIKRVDLLAQRMDRMEKEIAVLRSFLQQQKPGNPVRQTPAVKPLQPPRIRLQLEKDDVKEELKRK